MNEVVLVGNDDSKRLNWPLGRIIELLPGKDGKVRLVRVKTTKGQLLRPVQRIYPLECVDSTEESINKGDCAGVPEVSIDLKSRVPENSVKTRSGRISKMPERFS